MKKLVLFAIAAALIGLGVFWLLTTPESIPQNALAAYQPNLANGKVMFEAGGCASCHATPGQEDRTKLGGGLALHSPFGIFYAPNISSDKKDGVGNWSEANFVTAMLKGTSPDGSHYYPSFPYTSFQRMRVEDVRDLFAFIKTLPAVTSQVPEHDLPFPFNIRRPLGFWKLLFVDGQPFKPDPAQSAKWNRGAYLVNGPGHCAECHSPRNLLGGIVSGKRFAGGPAPDGKGMVPNITQAGLKKWSEGDLADMLNTGMLPDGDFIGGSMAEVVKNMSQLTKEDREAMAHYLKSLPPVEGPAPAKK